MNVLNWKVWGVFLFSFLLLSIGLIVLLSPPRTPNLAQTICQPSDLGERYHPTDGPANLTTPYLKETVVETYTVTLIDQQLTYTTLNCGIIRYADENAAQQVFGEICANQIRTSDMQIGDEACAYAGHAPHNLAFRRKAYLVLMSGDIGGVGTFPARAVDARLRQ